MKCSRCGEKAVTYLRPHRIALCGRCYRSFYERLVERSIKKFGILKKDERILACVSGGKDSAAMAAVLKELGFRIEMLHIDLGIGSYSAKSKRISEELAESLDAEINVVRLKDYGFDRYVGVELGRSPDFVKLAEAYGAEGVRPGSIEEFEKAVKRAAESEVATVIDVAIDPEENVFPMVPPGKGLRDILMEA